MRDVKLPEARQMFALVRDLAHERDLGEIAVPSWMVQRHHLGPLASRGGAARFRDELVRSSIQWARMVRDVPPVIADLGAANVRVATLKGISYASGLYRDPTDRPMTDIDLLVEPERVQDACDVLARLGFAREPAPALHHASTWVRGGLVIDLHHAILAGLDISDAWSRLRPGWPDSAWRLDPVDELVFHFVHMARNRLCGPMIQIVDAARLLARLSPAQLALARVRARTWQVATRVDAAWLYCAYVLDGGSPPARWLLPREDDAIAARQPSTVRKVVFDLATTGSASQAARRVVRYLYRAARTPSKSS